MGDWRNSVYAWTLEVWERKGRMGTPRNNSEKGEWGTPSPLSHYCALGFPPSLISQKPREFRHKLSFLGPLLQTSLLTKVGLERNGFQGPWHPCFCQWWGSKERLMSPKLKSVIHIFSYRKQNQKQHFCFRVSNLLPSQYVASGPKYSGQLFWNGRQLAFLGELGCAQ